MTSNMTELEKSRCHKLIHSVSATTATIGAGLAQVPGSDSAAIMPLQIGMIVGLAKIFEKEIAKSSAEAILISQLASHTGRAISQLLVGWIPGIGNAINAATAAGLTEAIGWSVAKDFALEKNLSK